ncbi:MAG: hypothetical protein NTX50_11850 [Candidatus Sumerlaeota bacterium]|nr:hypothetical protein [Candidatus Sumerlaeota bacterium]
MNSKSQYVVCVDNEGHEVSLEIRKTYKTIPDALAAKHGMVRVIDESGEDYLFDEGCFKAINIPQSIASAFTRYAKRIQSTLTRIQPHIPASAASRRITAKGKMPKKQTERIEKRHRRLTAHSAI